MSKEEMKKDKPVQKELEEMSPALAKMQGKEGFRTPTGYFSDLSDRTIATLKRAETGRQQANAGERNLQVSFRRVLQPQYIIAYAAALALLLVVVFLVRHDSSKGQYADITTEEAFRYVAANINDYGTVELYSALEQGEEATILSSIEETEADIMYDMILDDIDVEDLETIMEEL